MRPMVFVPVTADDLRTLRAAGQAEHAVAYAATAGLRSAYGLGPGEDEEADHVAQVLASVARTVEGLPRAVVAAEVAALPAPVDGVLGGVGPARVRWADVRALFTDDPDDLPDAGTLAAAARGELEGLDAFPLLWFAPSEAEQVLDLLTTDREGA